MDLPTTPPRIDPMRGFATAVIVLSSGLAAVLLVMSFAAIGAVNGIRTGASADDVDVWLSALSGSLATGAVVLMAVTWGTTSAWIVGAQRASEVLYPHTEQRRGTFWVYFGWVIPFANLFVPKMVVNDLVKASGNRPGDATGWWWVSWVVLMLLSRFTEDASFSGDAAALRLMVVLVLLAILTLVALSCWIVVVRRITEGLSDPAAHAAYENRYRAWVATKADVGLIRKAGRA